MSFEEMRQQQRDELVRLQTQKLQREQHDQRRQVTKRQIAVFVLIAFVLLKFVLKHPKTTLVLLILGYGVLQFGAPAQGSEFNRWVVTLFTHPGQAGNEFLTTVNLSNSDNSTVASPISDNSTVSSTGSDPTTAPLNIPSVVAPAPVAVNPICKQYNWSSPDDLPYLHYYKCPNPNTGD